MKVMGFVVIVVGLVMIYVGVTGSQHMLMATLKGSSSPVASGATLKPSGSAGSPSSGGSSNGGSSNPPPTTMI